MTRDYARFPNDDNGNVLWHMYSRGDALTKVRELDFTIILPSEHAAIELAVICLQSGFKVELQEAEEHHQDGLNWHIVVYSNAIPTHADITMLEQSLGKQAAVFGGRTSGWSSTFVPSDKL